MGSVSLLVERTNRKFLQTSVPFVPNLKVFVGAIGVLLGLKQFHAIPQLSRSWLFLLFV